LAPAPPLGLLLPGRCAAGLVGPALAEAEFVFRCAEGDTEVEAAVVGGGRSEAKEGLS
jgi:hypothetical protein